MLHRLVCLVLACLAAAPAGETLVVACGRGESLVGPILARAQEALGLNLDIRYGATPALAAQMAAEGQQSAVDVFLAQEAGYLAALGRNGRLAPLPAAITDRVEPRLRDPNGQWVATSGRLRVLVIDGSLPEAERPRSLRDLADPRWRGQIGWAPTNASFQAHVSLLRRHWGEAPTEAWLRAMAANGARAYPRNGPQVAAVDRGEIRIGWVNHYYLHQARRSGSGTAVNASFPSEALEGNMLLVSGIGIRAESPRQEAAQRLITWLLSEEGQGLFAAGFEYPVVPGIPAHPEVQALSDIPLVTVEAEVMTDLGSTVDMLRRVGLL